VPCARHRSSPSGNASRRASRTTRRRRSAAISRSTRRSRRSTWTPTPCSRSAAGSESTGADVRRPRVNPAWWLIGPALGVIAFFFVAPVAASFLLSLTDFDIYAVARPEQLRVIWLGNYRHLLADPRFWRAFRTTAGFVLVAGPLSIGVSLGAALLLDARLARWKPLFRTALFLPVVTTLVAVAIVWRYLYNPRAGLLNELLGLAGVAPIDWLGDPHWAMPAIILLAVWENFGFNMILFVAAWPSIPWRLR